MLSSGRSDSNNSESDAGALLPAAPAENDTNTAVTEPVSRSSRFFSACRTAGSYLYVAAATTGTGLAQAGRGSVVLAGYAASLSRSAVDKAWQGSLNYLDELINAANQCEAVLNNMANPNYAFDLYTQLNCSVAIHELTTLLVAFARADSTITMEVLLDKFEQVCMHPIYGPFLSSYLTELIDQIEKTAELHGKDAATRLVTKILQGGDDQASRLASNALVNSAINQMGLGSQIAQRPLLSLLVVSIPGAGVVALPIFSILLRAISELNHNNNQLDQKIEAFVRTKIMRQEDVQAAINMITENINSIFNTVNNTANRQRLVEAMQFGTRVVTGRSDLDFFAAVGANLATDMLTPEVIKEKILEVKAISLRIQDKVKNLPKLDWDGLMERSIKVTIKSTRRDVLTSIQRALKDCGHSNISAAVGILDQAANMPALATCFGAINQIDAAISRKFSELVVAPATSMLVQVVPTEIQEVARAGLDGINRHAAAVVGGATSSLIGTGIVDERFAHIQRYARENHQKQRERARNTVVIGIAGDGLVVVTFNSLATKCYPHYAKSMDQLGAHAAKHTLGLLTRTTRYERGLFYAQQGGAMTLKVCEQAGHQLARMMVYAAANPSQAGVRLLMFAAVMLTVYYSFGAGKQSALGNEFEPRRLA